VIFEGLLGSSPLEEANNHSSEKGSRLDNTL
jgi:hypothetical protein